MPDVPALYANALVDLTYIALGVVVVVGVVAVLMRNRSPRGDRSRQAWIESELARQEAAYPGGTFSDDEYMARLEALEDRWDDEHG